VPDTYMHRKGEVTLTLLGPDRRPLADRVVTVAQRRHAFAFGNLGFDFVPLVAGPGPAEVFGGATGLGLDTLAGLWLNLFNTATLPFYWGRYEPRRGRPDVDRLTATARWLADAWRHREGPSAGVAHRAAGLAAGPAAGRGGAVAAPPDPRSGGGFAGTIDVWDAINEAVIMPVFTNGDNAITPLACDRGRIAMVRLAFEEARAANPSATLVLNDFDLSSAYECLIEGVLEAGVRIDAIGLQTHMHQGYRGEEYMRRMLDRFARFGLPLHMTETTSSPGT
jgi:endo-1,4-beta-xylanase